MTTWFTSDWHFDHDKDFIWKVRGFSSVDEMNNEIIKRYNEVIKNDDTVYILGDIMMGNNYYHLLQILTNLKGKKFLAYGNHDTDKRLTFFEDLGVFEDIQMGYRIKKGKKRFIATHYPTLVSNTTRDGLYGISGHTHSKNIISEVPKCINVAVDAWNCYPVSIDQIIEVIKNEKEKWN